MGGGSGDFKVESRGVDGEDPVKSPVCMLWRALIEPSRLEDMFNLERFYVEDLRNFELKFWGFNAEGPGL